MFKQVRLSNSIGVVVSLVLSIGLLVGLGVIYSKEKAHLNNIVHDKVERVLLALKSSHIQAMLYRGNKIDNNPVLQAFNGTIESISSTQALMDIWLIMGPKVVEFQRNAGSNEVEPPIDEIDREALLLLKPVRRYISDNIYRYTVPIILGKGDGDNPACFNCHGDDMGIQAGEAIGGFSIAYNAKNDIRDFWSLMYRSAAIFTFIAVAVTIVIVVGINRLISRPIELITSAMDTFSERDKDILIPDPKYAKSIEISTILKSLRKYSDIAQSNLDEMKRALDEHNIASITDIEGNITYANDKFCELSGYSRKEILGQNHRILKSGEHSPDMYADLWDTIRTGKVWKGEIKNKTKDGEYYWVKVTIVPFLTKSGNPYQYLAIRSDITDEKSKEQELKSATNAAEASNVAKSNFLSTMSHEIRTPMNVVISMSQLLELTSLSDRQKNYLGMISQAGDSLLTLIDDILDFSKLDANMTEIDSYAFDLERVCQESMELIASNAIGTGIEFVFDYQPDCPRHFMGDPPRIRQVLFNLIGNALKFTDEGFVRLGVSHTTTNTGEEELRLEIQDTGIGLKLDQIGHIFDEFTQADSSNTRNYGGTGLGLAITKKLVTLMGGKIGVDSVYGEGSTFWINCDLPKAEEPTPLKGSSLKGTRILFVDDSREIRPIFKCMLDHMGANTTIVSNPVQVLEQLRDAKLAKSPFRIAILDHHMPGITGLDLGAEIRSERQFNNLKLLILLSAGEKLDATIFAQAGFNAYSNKLTRYSTLNAMLTAMLDHTSDKSLITQHSIEDAKQSVADINQSISASVLLVDDVYLNQIATKELLEHIGIDVDVVNNGQEAIDAFSSHAYDLIFMDCRMPVMDGYKATQAIRQLEKENNKGPIPIIAMTANALSDDQLLCEQAGMNEVITKPFKFADLCNCLQQWLPHLQTST